MVRFGDLHLELPGVFPFLHRGRDLALFGNPKGDPRRSDSVAKCESYETNQVIKRLTGYQSVDLPLLCSFFFRVYLLFTSRIRPPSNNEKTNARRSGQEERDL